MLVIGNVCLTVEALQQETKSAEQEKCLLDNSAKLRVGGFYGHR